MNDVNICTQPLRLEPQYRDYVWGGKRLRPDVPGPTAEAWVIYEHDKVIDGPFSGQTLGQVSADYALQVLGSNVAARGKRFPLLIKLLDCAEWLSLQVHPNDEQARRLEGPDQNGKTEAWYIVEAEPGAALLAGVKSGAPKDEFQQSVRDGTIMDWVNKLEMHTGESLLIRAGLIHALGPGLFVYEVQQTSDITYRVYDWGRPATGARPLHIEKSLEVINQSIEPKVNQPPDLSSDGRALLVQSEYFRLLLLETQDRPLLMDTYGESFHALTVLEGSARLRGNEWETTLGQFQSAVVPAACGTYQILPEPQVKLLRSAVD